MEITSLAFFLEVFLVNISKLKHLILNSNIEAQPSSNKSGFWRVRRLASYESVTTVKIRQWWNRRTFISATFMKSNKSGFRRTRRLASTEGLLNSIIAILFTKLNIFTLCYPISVMVHNLWATHAITTVILLILDFLLDSWKLLRLHFSCRL